MSRTYERYGLMNRAGEAAAPLQRSSSKHYTPVKNSSKSDNRLKNANHLTPDTNTQYRANRSPMLDPYNRTMERLEDKLHKLTQEKERQERDSSKLKRIIHENEVHSRTSMDRLDNQMRRSRRMENQLIEALSTIQRLESDNLGLKNTLTVNDRRWQEEYNSLRREYEHVNRCYNNLRSETNNNKAYAYHVDSPPRFRKESRPSRDKCSRCIKLQAEVEKLTRLNGELRECLDRVQAHQILGRKVTFDYNQRHLKSANDSYIPRRSKDTDRKVREQSVDNERLKREVTRLQESNKLLLELTKKLQADNEKLLGMQEQQRKKNPPTTNPEPSILRRQIEELKKSLEHVENLNTMLKSKNESMDAENRKLRATLQEERKKEEQRERDAQVERQKRSQVDQQPPKKAPSDVDLNALLEAERKRTAVAVDQFVRAKNEFEEDKRKTTKLIDDERGQWDLKRGKLEAAILKLGEEKQRLEKEYQRQIAEIEGKLHKEQAIAIEREKNANETTQSKDDEYASKLKQLSDRKDQEWTAIESGLKRAHEQAKIRLKNQHDQATQLLTNTHRQQLEQLTTSYEAMRKAQAEALQKERQDIISKLRSDQEAEKTRMEAGFQARLEELQKIKSELDLSEFQSQRKSIEQSKKELQEREQQLKDATSTLVQERQALEADRRAFEHQRVDIANAPVPEPPENPRVNELEGFVLQLEERIGGLRILITQQEGKLGEKEVEIEAHKGRIAELEQQLNTLTLKYREEIDTAVDLQAKLDEAKAEKESTELQLQGSKTAVGELEAVIQKINDDVAKEKSQLNDKLTTMEASVNRLIEDNRLLEQDLSQQTSERIRLEEALTQLQSAKPESVPEKEDDDRLRNDIQQAITEVSDRIATAFQEIQERKVEAISTRLLQIEEKVKLLAERVKTHAEKPKETFAVPEEIAQELYELHEQILQLQAGAEESAALNEHLQQNLESIRHQLQIRVEESTENMKALQGMREALIMLMIPKHDGSEVDKELVQRLFEVEDRMKQLELNLV